MLSGPFSVWRVQFPDHTWKIGVRLGDDEQERVKLLFDPDWIFKMVSDTYHFGESEGIRKAYEEIRNDIEFNKNRTMKDKISGLLCMFLGHKEIGAYCYRCMKSFKFA